MSVVITKTADNFYNTRLNVVMLSFSESPVPKLYFDIYIAWCLNFMNYYQLSRLA